jgi:serine/threonine protein kinase
MSDFWVGSHATPDTYRLVSLLGGGGEGDVWQAELALPEGGRRSVAVKITATSGDSAGDERWEQFGHLLRSLSHPGLVRVTDVFTGPGMHRAGEEHGGSSRYVVMDFIEGVSLREWIAENPDITASQRLRVLGMVAAALDEMHAGGTTEIAVAHGDVKPANIVVRADRGAVLVDLGFARLADTGGTAGRSATYAAPELRVRGALATPEADSYAFAVTAAQVLTGEPPPLDKDGWLDPVALRTQLSQNPLTARKHVLIRHLVDAIEAPLNARPRQLRPWLDNAVETLSQVTSTSLPVTASTPSTTTTNWPASLPAGALEQTAVPRQFGPTQQAQVPPLLRPSPPPAPVVPPRQPPLLPKAAPDQRRKPFTIARIAAVAVVLLGGMGVGSYLALTGPPQPPNVFREPVQTAGVDAYMSPVGKDAFDVKSPLQLHGNQPGGLPRLYGGIRNNAECDRAAMTSFLAANPDKGTEWAKVQGIQPTEVPSYVAQLTPVILLTDTSVTGHGFDGGRAQSTAAQIGLISTRTASSACNLIQSGSTSSRSSTSAPARP